MDKREFNNYKPGDEATLSAGSERTIEEQNIDKEQHVGHIVEGDSGDCDSDVDGINGVSDCNCKVELFTVKTVSDDTSTKGIPKNPEKPKAMPRNVAELIYSFLWLEFRGLPVAVDRLQKRFRQRMRRPLKEFVSWFAKVKVTTGLREYADILFDYVEIPAHEEEGKRYPSYFKISPLRNVDGMPITGIRVLTELEEKRLLKRLPDVDSFVNVTKLDFDLISREVGADRFSVMAATFWYIGYESRPEPNRTLSSAEAAYAGRGFVGICARSTDLDRIGKCEVRYALADDDGLVQPVQVTLLVDNTTDRINGEMVFGCFEEGDGSAVLYDGDLRFIRIVTWRDFLESERFATFEDWLAHDNGQGLFPYFKCSTRDIIILDAYLDDENGDQLGAFYQGLTMDFNSGRVFAGKLYKTVRSDFLYHDEIKEVLNTLDKWTPKDFGDETTSVVCSRSLESDIAQANTWQLVSVKGNCLTDLHDTTKEMNMQKDAFTDYRKGEEFDSCIGIYKKNGDRHVIEWGVSQDLLPLYKVLEFQIQADRHKGEQDWLIDGMLVEVLHKGLNLYGGNIDGMYRNKYVEIRKWEDFEEAHCCGCSFEEYINDGEGKSLTPRFKYLTPSIIVEAPDKKGLRYLYVGFLLEKDGKYVCKEIIARSEFTWEEYSKEESNYFHVVGGFERIPNRKYKVFECGVDGESEKFILINLFKSDVYDVSRIIQSADTGSQNGKYRWVICKKPKTAEEQERQFVKKFIEYATKTCGFTYDERDLIRFHTAVKCGRMTLLGGAPGCGKSKMVEIYARALCGDKYSDMMKPDGGEKVCPQTFLRVDVNPSWLEPSDIMGYYSLPTKEKKDGPQYHPALCGLKEFLDNRSVEVPELICFEEMNLARIEFYFSEFMQMLSRDTLELPTYNLKLREATRFVGTFNDDATTQRMSSRFLDRCSVIMLGDVSDEERPFALKRGKVIPWKGNGISESQYRKWIKGVGDISDDIVKETNDLYQQIIQKFKSKANNTKGLNIKPSPRVREEILLYIVNRIFLDEDDNHVVRAFDEAFAQRVISKFDPNPLHEKKYAKLASVLKDVLDKGSLSAKLVCDLEKQSHAVAMWAEEEDVIEKMP